MHFTLKIIVLCALASSRTTGVPCKEPCLYYAELNVIRRVPLQNSTGTAIGGTVIQTVYNGGQRINVLALDHKRERIFWYDIGSRMIYRAHINGSNAQPLIKYGVSLCEGITYDWSADNIYWTDSLHDWIEVATADGKNRKAIINGSMEQPRGIIVAPNDGYLFWTEFGSTPRIERSRLNGAERKVIAQGNLRYPNDLQIDYSTKRLYWIDAGTDKIESCEFTGAVRRIETDVSYYGRILMHPFSLALWSRHSIMYFTDWYRSWVLYKSTVPNSRIMVLYGRVQRLKQIGQVRIFHSSNEPTASSPCLINNGNCSHLCLRTDATNFTCACPTGEVLVSPQNKQCVKAELQYQLFVVDGKRSTSKILHLSKFLGQPQYQFEALKLRDDAGPVGLDFDKKNNIIYWGDFAVNKIYKMFANGSGLQVVADTGIETPEGLAIDTVTGLLYVADYMHETIEVIKLDGSMRKVIVNRNLINPRGLQLYHEKGLLFFSDWDEDFPKIESAFMDGTNRKVIVSTSIDTPSGLAIDKIEQRIYWADMYLDRIESAKLDGTDRRILFDHDGYDSSSPFESVTGEIQTPFGVAIYGDQIFWSDWGRRAVFAADKRFGGKIDLVTGGLIKPLMIHAYSRKPVKEYKKIYFFARVNFTSSGAIFCSRNCTNASVQDPAPCPQGYKQSRLDVTCSNCSAPFGYSRLRCKCENWMSCAHRIYSKLFCLPSQPFMQIKVRECVRAVNPGHCPSAGCPGSASKNCSSDGDCADDQKCCKTDCGAKCLRSSIQPEKHPCQISNGGCSHLCFRIPNGHSCGCPANMILQAADNKTCISPSGYCATKQPCVNGGVCRDINSTTFQCTCKTGFHGSRCENCSYCPSYSTCKLKEDKTTCLCPANYCKNNGSCTFHGNVSICNCPEGYFGGRCEIYNPCPPSYCMNKGICTSHVDRHTCNCSDAFTGQRCETLKLCVKNPCSNGGTCSNLGTARICTCTPQYTGENCETNMACYPNPCSNNGTCTASANQPNCHCASGYSGDRCQYYDQCLSGPCKNNANCSSVMNTLTCQCGDTFTGRFCETAITCSAGFCKNGGTCYISNFIAKCRCPAYYTGVNCETYMPCSPSPCQQNGQCSPASSGSFQCLCPRGYWGNICQNQNKCFWSPCKNGGKCTNVTSGSGYKCQCNAGFTGSDCSTIDNCASSPCKNGGSCLLDGSSYTCKCKEGYKGSNCETRDFCAVNQCRKPEFCLEGTMGYTCKCDIGYTGQHCRTLIDYCQEGNACLNGGTCINRLAGAACNCLVYYAGANCGISYRANILAVTFAITKSSNASSARIRRTLSAEYTTYCQSTDCFSGSVTARKRRNVKTKVTITDDDIILLPGYPKIMADGNFELHYTVQGEADGKSLILSASAIQEGFGKFKEIFAAYLRVEVLKAELKNETPKTGKSKDNNSKTSTGGLAAGLVILFLCLLAAMVAITYFYKRRRQGESKSFIPFDNPLYRSNADFGKEGPSVEINQGPTRAKEDVAPLEFDNVMYDSRHTYAEIMDVNLPSKKLPQEPGTLQVESSDGMTGVVNPYVELPENERSLPSLVKTNSVTIVSSTNVRVGSVAAIEVFEDDLKPKADPPSSQVLEEPRRFEVKSTKEETSDAVSGFANPCAAFDDNIFSEDDTREGLDFGESKDISMSHDVHGTPDVADGNLEEKKPDGSKPTSSETTADSKFERNRGDWVRLENEPNFDSSA